MRISIYGVNIDRAGVCKNELPCVHAHHNKSPVWHLSTDSQVGCDFIGTLDRADIFSVSGGIIPGRPAKWCGAIRDSTDLL